MTCIALRASLLPYYHVDETTR